MVYMTYGKTLQGLILHVIILNHSFNSFGNIIWWIPLNLYNCAPNENSNQPAHAHSEDSDQCANAVWFWLFTGRTSPKVRFLTFRLILFYIFTKTRLFKYIENFTTKNWKFSDKKSYIFHISAQNIDCGYSLEPTRWGGSNEYPQCMFLSRN